MTTTIHPGTNLIRLPSMRRAQVSAITKTHAIIYYPDKDEQTSVRLERFNRRNEWRVKQR